MAYRRKTSWFARIIDWFRGSRSSLRIPAGDADGYVDWP